MISKAFNLLKTLPTYAVGSRGAPFQGDRFFESIFPRAGSGHMQVSCKHKEDKSFCSSYIESSKVSADWFSNMGFGDFHSLL